MLFELISDLFSVLAVCFEILVRFQIYVVILGLHSMYFD